MIIYKTVLNTIYLNNSINVTIEVNEDNSFEILKISSIFTQNPNEFSADNILYVKNIRENKKELKKELKELNLWEKGMIKTIEYLFKESVKG